MKKLFFFRSNASNSADNSQVLPASPDKSIYREKPTEIVDKHRIDKNGSENQVVGSTPPLRRSLSFSSGSRCNRNLVDQAGSPCSTSNSLHKHGGRSACYRTLTPERHARPIWYDGALIQNGQILEKCDPVASRAYSDISENSSYCSSNVENKVLDRYMDGEHNTETNSLKSQLSRRNHLENGNSRKLPPKIQSTGTLSQNDDRKQKPKSQSFRENKASQLQFSSSASVDNGFPNESPRKLAKHVIERLSQSQFLHKTRSIDPDMPITIEQIYNGAFDGSPQDYSDEFSEKKYMVHGHTETTDKYHHEERLELSQKELGSGDKYGFVRRVEAANDADVELVRKLKEAEHRASILSEELDQENFLHFKGLSIPRLIQTVRSLMEDKVNMAVEVSALLQDQIAERALFKEELKLASASLNPQTRRLEKEKQELQSSLEKELDRRSTEWSHKLEKYQAEENRLRERVRELAEQNVCLQREVSSFSERKMDMGIRISNSEKELEELTTQVNKAAEEKQHFQKNIAELEDKLKAAEEGRACFQRSYEEKFNECKDMYRSISRLQRTCNDQEKTIDGLRGLCEDLGKKISSENRDLNLEKLQMEHVRLTRVEQALRKEVESYRLEVESLRGENINLLNRLKNNGKDSAASTFKLDLELQNRISPLENQALTVLIENNQFSRKLLEYIKVTEGCTQKTRQVSESIDIIECEVKLQGLEQASENMRRSMQAISSVLQSKSMKYHEKFDAVSREFQSPSLGDSSGNIKDERPEDSIKSELKAEILLTKLLREKIYSKELDVEQLQAELAAAIRSNDILKCEVQNAFDNFSCVNHRLKDLELQMMKKDETINCLQSDLQECKKELTLLRGILAKVSQERDLMWEEVKQFSEKNMSLNSEVNVLTKKIEALDEDILLKEGQISILKDSIGKPFDLLASADSTREFLLE